MALFNFKKKQNKEEKATPVATKVEVKPIEEPKAKKEAEVAAPAEKKEAKPIATAKKETSEPAKTVKAKAPTATDKKEAPVKKEAKATEKTAETKKTTTKAAPEVKKAPATPAETKKTPVGKAPEVKKASAKATAKTSAPEKAPEPAPVKEEYTGRFEINKSKDGKKYFFNLYASNKVGIATSQMYSSAQSALNGIKSVIANADKAPVEDQSLKKYDTLPFPKWEIYIDNGGKFRFRLNASNGNCVCHSQGYTTKTACKNGIDSIIRSSRNAEIDKTYISKKDEE